MIPGLKIRCCSSANLIFTYYSIRYAPHTSYSVSVKPVIHHTVKCGLSSLSEFLKSCTQSADVLLLELDLIRHILNDGVSQVQIPEVYM